MAWAFVTGYAIESVFRIHGLPGKRTQRYRC
jgi:hypothetical protein